MLLYLQDSHIFNLNPFFEIFSFCMTQQKTKVFESDIKSKKEEERKGNFCKACYKGNL